MTQEQKDILLKDLCARLPYGVKVKLGDNPNIFDLEYRIKFAIMYGDSDKLEDILDITNIKPYLFPLSSMTEEQKKDIFRNGTFFFDRHNTLCRVPKHNDDYDYATFEDYLEITEKLNKNHFDYRGLISKGLANDATGLNIYQL